MCMCKVCQCENLLALLAVASGRIGPEAFPATRAGLAFIFTMQNRHIDYYVYYCIMLCYIVLYFLTICRLCVCLFASIWLVDKSCIGPSLLSILQYCYDIHIMCINMNSMA